MIGPSPQALPPQTEDHRKVYIETFGCQMNILDSELVLAGLLKEGYFPTKDSDSADLILYNTCSVRQHAEDKVWSRLGTLRDRKIREPQLIIGVMGCMAQNEKDIIVKRMPHVDLVCGTKEFDRLPSLVKEIREERSIQIATDLTRPITIQREVSLRPSHFHAFVSVMRGCDFGCTYCIVPATRGPEINRPIDEIKTEVENLVADGVKEVTLLGQTIDSYGKRLPGRPNLGDLLESIHDIDGLARIRFITSHPSLMREPILRRMGELPKVCEYLHIPAQSGSNDQLQAMRRGYTREKYLEIVAMARDLVPGVAIASDFIVGFPGETDEDFEATCDLIREIKPHQSYVFKYSPRPHTPAIEWTDDVPWEVKKDRNRRLLEIQEEIDFKRNFSMLDEIVEVLVEGPSKRDPRHLAGRSRHNEIVIFDGPEDLVGEILQVTITSCTPLTLFGDITIHAVA